MTLQVSDLFAAQTQDQIRASMVTNLITLGVPADKWRAGGVASSILTVSAMALALMSTVIATLIQGFFLPTATGNSLRLLAQYMYGVTIPQATFASGNVTLTNPGGATFTIAIGGYVCQNPTTKVTYTNAVAFVLNPGGTATFGVVSNTVGSAGNAVAGAINTNVTSLIGGVTVTNPAALVGIDTPSDAIIRTLCLNKLGALSVRGVRTAYAYAIQIALNSVTGAPVNISRWSVSSASHTGIVTVVVASPTGPADPNDVIGVGTSIEANARPEAVSVNASGATALAYAPALTIWCTLPNGVNSAQVKTAIDAALVTFISTYPIGGQSANDDANPSTPVTALFADGVKGAVAAAVVSVGGLMISCQGATDLVLTPTQVATNGITTSIRVIAPISGTLTS